MTFLVLKSFNSKSSEKFKIEATNLAVICSKLVKIVNSWIVSLNKKIRIVVIVEKNVTMRSL